MEQARKMLADGAHRQALGAAARLPPVAALGAQLRAPVGRRLSLAPAAFVAAKTHYITTDSRRTTNCYSPGALTVKTTPKTVHDVRNRSKCWCSTSSEPPSPGAMGSR